MMGNTKEKLSSSLFSIKKLKMNIKIFANVGGIGNKAWKLDFRSEFKYY